MDDYELGNAARWEDTEKKPQVRVPKHKAKKKKKKRSTAGSVTGSVAGSVVGSGSVAGSVRGQISRPITPIQSSPSPSPSSSNHRGGVPVQQSPGSTSSGGVSLHPPTPQYQNGWSTPSEPDLLEEEGEETTSPWGKEARYREHPLDSDSNAEPSYPDNYFHGYAPELDEAHGLSSYTLPNFYFNEDPSLEFDGYEGPDGLMRENDGDRAERAGEPHSGKHF